jgi:hypothetical protein
VETVKDIALILHFLGLAAIIGGFLVQTRSAEKTIHAAMLHGALTQLVTGVILVGLNEALGHDVVYAKIGVKLVIALAVTVLAWRYRAKPRVATVVWAAVGGLTIVNVIIAVVWK